MWHPVLVVGRVEEEPALAAQTFLLWSPLRTAFFGHSVNVAESPPRLGRVTSKRPDAV